MILNFLKYKTFLNLIFSIKFLFAKYIYYFNYNFKTFFKSKLWKKIFYKVNNIKIKITKIKIENNLECKFWVEK